MRYVRNVPPHLNLIAIRTSMLRFVHSGKTSIRSFQGVCSLWQSRRKGVIVPDPLPKGPNTPTGEQIHDVEQTYAYRVLELIPDADLDFVLDLVAEFHPIHGERVADHVINVLLPVQTYSKGKEPEIVVSDDIECGCCFSEYPIVSDCPAVCHALHDKEEIKDQIVQCPEAHLFCASCITTQTSTLLTTCNPHIKCIDQSGCTAEIPASELRRFLPENVLILWERVNQWDQLESAGLTQLVECPFCDWACLVDDEDEQFLFCRNHDICGVVSCRWCKKKVSPSFTFFSMTDAHCCGIRNIIQILAKVQFRRVFPSSLLTSLLDTVDDEKGQHTIDEAMSMPHSSVSFDRYGAENRLGSALVRNCPKCNKGMSTKKDHTYHF